MMEPDETAPSRGGEEAAIQKERNYFQMIEVLMTRLKRMEGKVDERKRACAADQVCGWVGVCLCGCTGVPP